MSGPAAKPRGTKPAALAPSPVGQSVSHESAEAHVTGRALYTDDLAGRYANLLHAWPVQSEHAHARITKIDTASALALPGVVHVLTAADVRGEGNTGASKHDEPLFPEEALFHGHPIVWVLAESEPQAIAAAAAVRIVYAPLPSITTIEGAIAADSFHTPELRMARGDVTTALASAPHRLSGEFFIGGQEHFYLEMNAAIAHVDESGHLFVQSSTQHPAETQEIVARVLGRPKNEVVCQSLRMGGAFGGKEVQANLFAAIAALGATVTGRPVRVRMDRLRDFTITGKRHPFLSRFEVGYDDSGKLLALDAKLWSDGGWSLDLSRPVLSRAMFHIDNAYFVPNLQVLGRVCNTHKTSQTAFRGFGGPQGMLVMEDILDRVARSLSLPPHVVRERNFYREAQTTHYGQTVAEADRIERIWTELKQTSDFDARREAIRTHNAAHPHEKRGMAITPVKFGISFTATFYNQGGALVLVYKDGTVQVNHGGTEMGQGLHTKMRQIAAQNLGVPLSHVTIMPTRTDKVPNTSATAASAGTDLNGAAVKDACDRIRTRLADVAATMLDTTADDIRIENGTVRSERTKRSASFEELVFCAYMNRVQLFETGFYRTPDLQWDEAAGRGKPFHYFAYGAAVTEVSVDTFTGQYRVLRADVLHDVGDSISPLVDKGQVEGGFIQGLGWLTQEELVWDKEGRLRTGNASTYKLPSLGECPGDFRVNLLTRAATPGVIHGSKAVGEPPFMLAMSVREALRDAVAACAAPGAVVELASPATPEAVYWALKRFGEKTS